MILPEMWVSVLERVRALTDGHAVIAGGCLRDLDNGRPVKDVDIFFRDDVDTSIANTVRQAVEQMLPETTPSGTTQFFYEGSGLEVTSTCEVGEFNLVGLDAAVVNAETVCARIDFGFCRLAFDGLTFLLTPEYLKDRGDKTFTLYCPEREERARRRFDRLSLKYPEFSLVIPDAAP